MFNLNFWDKSKLYFVFENCNRHNAKLSKCGEFYAKFTETIFILCFGRISEQNYEIIILKINVHEF